MNRNAIFGMTLAVAALVVAMAASAFGDEVPGKEGETRFRVPVSDVRVEEELTEKQAYSALCGIALRRFEKESPDLDTAGLGAVAHGYEILQDKEKAADIYRQAIAKSANDGWSLTAGGAVFQEVNRSDEAEASLRKALGLADKGYAVGTLAKVYFDAQRFEEFPDLLPGLLKHRFEWDNLCLRALCAYAAAGPDVEFCREILQEALDDVSDDYLLHNTELGMLADRALLRCGFQEREAALRQKWGKQEESLPIVAARIMAFYAAGQAAQERATRRTLAFDGGAEHRPPDRDGVTVREIEVQSVNEYTTTTPNAVRAVMELKVGQPYANWVVDDDIRNLYGTGLISNTRIFGSKLDDGVKITVVIYEELTR